MLIQPSFQIICHTRVNTHVCVVGKNVYEHRLVLNTTSLRASDRCHWRGVRPAGAIRLFSGGRGRPPLQGQSAVFIPGSTADGAATRHGSCTGGVQCSLSACTISRFARCCPRLAPFALWSPRTVSLFAQDRKEKWVLLCAGRTQLKRGCHVAYPKHIAPRGCGALLLYLSRPWARSISSFRAMSFGDRST